MPTPEVADSLNSSMDIASSYSSGDDGPVDPQLLEASEPRAEDDSFESDPTEDSEFCHPIPPNSGQFPAKYSDYVDFLLYCDCVYAVMRRFFVVFRLPRTASDK